MTLRTHERSPVADETTTDYKSHRNSYGEGTKINMNQESLSGGPHPGADDLHAEPATTMKIRRGATPAFRIRSERKRQRAVRREDAAWKKSIPALLLLAAAVWSFWVAVMDLSFSRLSDGQLAMVRYNPARDAQEEVGRALDDITTAMTGRRPSPPPQREPLTSRAEAQRFAVMEGCVGLVLLAGASLLFRRPRQRHHHGNRGDGVDLTAGGEGPAPSRRGKRVTKGRPS